MLFNNWIASVTLAIIFGLAGLTACQTTQTSATGGATPVALTQPGQSVEYLSADQIRATFTDTKVVEVHGKWTQTFTKSGKIEGPHAGEWRIEGNQLCADFAGNNYDWCGKATMVEEDVYAFHNHRGQELYRVKLVSG